MTLLPTARATRMRAPRRCRHINGLHGGRLSRAAEPVPAAQRSIHVSVTHGSSSKRDDRVRRQQTMPRGSKDKYTSKQKRMAEHIEKSYESRGTSEKEAERRAWATVNAETHGGKKSGSGRGRKM